MTDVDGTCEYVLDPKNPETWGGEEDEGSYRLLKGILNEDDVWTCPHDAKDGKNLCVFHLPLSEKNEEEVIDAFLDVLDEVTENDGAETDKLQFLGAIFGNLDLSEMRLNVEEASLDMRFATFKSFDASNSIFNIHSAIFHNSKFTEQVKFDGVRFDGDIEFSRAEFEQAHFSHTEFYGDVNFFEVKFNGMAFFGMLGLKAMLILAVRNL